MHKLQTPLPYYHRIFRSRCIFGRENYLLSCEVGGDLPQLIGDDIVQKTIDYTDKIYLEFGADSKNRRNRKNSDEVKEIRKRAIVAGLKLVDCPIRHLGTEHAHEIYYAIEQYLLKNGVEMLFNHECTNLKIVDGKCLGVYVSDKNNDFEILRRSYCRSNGNAAALIGLNAYVQNMISRISPEL